MPHHLSTGPDDDDNKCKIRSLFPKAAIMRILLLFFCLVLYVTGSLAQSSFKKNTFYFEVAGNGPVLSVNYERQLKNKPGLGFHIGLGLGGIYPDVPMGITYLFGSRGKKSFLEVGAGITLAEQAVWDEHPVVRDNYPFKPAFIPSIGYRHQTHYGLMWKINYTPIFTRYRNLPFYFGISVGWNI